MIEDVGERDDCDNEETDNGWDIDDVSAADDDDEGEEEDGDDDKDEDDECGIGADTNEDDIDNDEVDGEGSWFELWFEFTIKFNGSSALFISSGRWACFWPDLLSWKPDGEL